MSRFKLTIEYAGTRYSGWQIQKNARTVQGAIDRAIRAATARKEFELYGSGRTDAGVHALGQVAHLDIATTLPPDVLRDRINAELPADINIFAAAIVPRRFHARHHAVARRYLYQIATRRTAFAKPYVWWVREPLDVERMTVAAAGFAGMRDFASFSHGGPSAQKATAADLANVDAVDDTDDDERSRQLVLIERVAVARTGSLVLVSVEGSHFLWKMVRRMVGVLVEIGRGALEPSVVGELLAERSSIPAQVTAPPSGLFLERVFYQGDRRATEPPAPAVALPGDPRPPS